MAVQMVFAQGKLTVTTNKSIYSYGEQIVVYAKYSNTTDTTFSFFGDPFSFTRIAFEGVNFINMASTADGEYHYQIGDTRTWIWRLDPKVLGLPVKDGNQKITATFLGKLKDSIYVTAPAYRGGRIQVSLKPGVNEVDLQKLRDSINAQIIQNNGCGSYSCIQFWQITNHSIDSLSIKLKADTRFVDVIPLRIIKFDSTYFTPTLVPENIPHKYSHLQNYPNPFNPITTIVYEIPVYSHVKMIVYNSLGVLIKTLQNKYQSPGIYKVYFNAIGLASGVYYYQLLTENKVITKKLLLIK